MKKKMLAFASATLSLFWLAVLLVSAKTEKAQFLGKWDSVAVDGGGNKTLSLIAGGPASSLLARLYEDNTTASGADPTQRPIRAASDMGRFSESAYTLVKDQIDVRDVDPVHAKGKSKPLNVYEVVGLK